MKNIGIWIDHKKAFIVSITGERVETRWIESSVERRVRLSGGSRTSTPYGPQTVASERKKEERQKHQLQTYYQEVIEMMGEAKKIFIFGPGEAKVEFAKEMEKKKDLSDKIAGIEPADKMTEAQIEAKVRSFYSVLKARHD